MPSDPRGGASAPTTLQTVERALSFLECVATSAAPPTIREVADRLGLNITTCYHLYNTLAARRYVERNPDSTLRIGHPAAVLFDGYRRGSSSRRVIQDLVDQLSGTTGETSFLSVITDDSVLLTALAEGTHPVRASGLYVGLRGREHVRSSGRAVLAWLSGPAKEALLANALATVPEDQRPAILADLEAEIDRVRARGWAIDDGDFQPGIVGIAAPFHSRGGDVLGAIGIWAPADRATRHREKLVAEVLAAARSATAGLGSTQD